MNFEGPSDVNALDNVNNILPLGMNLDMKKNKKIEHNIQLGNKEDNTWHCFTTKFEYFEVDIRKTKTYRNRRHEQNSVSETEIVSHLLSFIKVTNRLPPFKLKCHNERHSVVSPYHFELSI